MYDAENRQVSYSVGGLNTIYQYDGEGQRVVKTGGGQTTVYVYDAFGNLAGEYGPGVGNPCGATSTCYYTQDNLGSVRMLTDANGQNVRHYDYLPFGEDLFAGTGGRTTGMGYLPMLDFTNPRFTGQMRDGESGFDFFHARYYGSYQGRFTSADPGNAGAAAGDPQSWNGYAYAGDNPLTFTDPNGLGFWSDLGGFLFNIGLNFLTGGLNNLFDSAVGGVIAGANSGPWNEQLPIGGFGGSLNTGGIFASGNTGPFIFSITPSNTLKGPGVTSPWEAMIDALYSFVGFGPKQITYGPRHVYTQNFQTSLGMEAIKARIRGNCGQSTGRLAVGTVEAAINTAIDAGTGNFSIAEAQLGAFDASYVLNGRTANVTVTNPISINSAMYHVFSGTASVIGRGTPAGKALEHFGTRSSNAPFGFGVVNQTLRITEPNPCF